MMEHQDSQSDVARRLSIKQPTVQKSLSKGKYYDIKMHLIPLGKL